MHLIFVGCHLLGVTPHLRQLLDGLELGLLACLILVLNHSSGGS